MQICREMAGYSYGRADLVRWAMSKKKHEVLRKEREVFIAGAMANGVSERIANEIFDEMDSFASYAFNKSHAAAYALVAYQTAWLKCHYPREYMAALLTSVLDNTDKVIDYIGEAKKLGIEVLPPDVQESGLGFTVVGDCIRFGLLAIKNLGRGFIGEMIRERERAPLNDLLDFLERMQGKDLNRRAVEALIKCGAFDRFGHNRNQMLSGFEKLLESVEATHRNNVAGQLDLFGNGGGDAGAGGEYAMPPVDELPLLVLLGYEKETTGLYLSGHPLGQHEALVKRIRPTPIQKVLRSEGLEGQIVQVVGIVASKRSRTTRSNEMMGFVFVEDMTASIEVIVFPKAFTEYSALLNVGTAVAVRGRVKSTEEESAQIVCEEILPLEKAAEAAFSPATRPQRSSEPPPRQKAAPERQAASSPPGRASDDPKRGLYLKFPTRSCEQVRKASNVLFVFEGNFPVYFYFVDTGKYVRAPQNYWISPNDVMLGELRRILGAENVVLRG